MSLAVRVPVEQLVGKAFGKPSVGQIVAYFALKPHPHHLHEFPPRQLEWQTGEVAIQAA